MLSVQVVVFLSFSVIMCLGSTFATVLISVFDCLSSKIVYYFITKVYFLLLSYHLAFASCTFIMRSILSLVNLSSIDDNSLFFEFQGLALAHTIPFLADTKCYLIDGIKWGAAGHQSIEASKSLAICHWAFTRRTWISTLVGCLLLLRKRHV